MFKKSKGFTIIELIVVIAIIAVLAAIVLVNVTSYINQGKGAGIQGNMATLVTNAAVYFDDNSANTGNNFTTSSNGCGVADGSAATSAIGAAVTKAGATLVCMGSTASGNQSWCARVLTMPTGSKYASYCVDSTGYKGVLISGKCTTGVFTCK